MSLRSRYLLLVGLRWFSTGLIIPVTILLPLSRGMTVAQAGAMFAVQGVVVLVLELPTGGLADAVGRKMVQLASGVVCLFALAVMFAAQTPVVLGVAYALFGVYRALDSGPLDAWFVDSVREHDATADITKGLSAASTVIGCAIGAGALGAGALIAWDPTSTIEALALPIAVALVWHRWGSVHRVAPIGPTTGRRRHLTGAPRPRHRRLARRFRTLGLRHGRVRDAHPCATLRDARCRDSRRADGSCKLGGMGGIRGRRRWCAVARGIVGLRRLAGLSRLSQALGVVALALATGPAGLIFAFFVVYLIHGMSGPLHSSLLHEQVDSRHRATVVSLSSLASQPAGSLAMVVLGAIATGASTSVAMLVGAVVLAIAAPLYLLVRIPQAYVRPTRDLV